MLNNAPKRGQYFRQFGSVGPVRSGPDFRDNLAARLSFAAAGSGSLLAGLKLQVVKLSAYDDALDSNIAATRMQSEMSIQVWKSPFHNLTTSFPHNNRVE